MLGRDRFIQTLRSYYYTTMSFVRLLRYPEDHFFPIFEVYVTYVGIISRSL